MNPLVGMLGLGFVLLFVALMILFAAAGRRSAKRYMRDIPAFGRLEKAVGLAVEAGQQLHLSLGSGGLNDVQAASALVGLSILQRIARAASVSDRPPVTTSGDGTLAILAQDSLRAAYQAIDPSARFDVSAGQVSGLTPFSYAAGALSLVYDQQVSANFLAGHFGSEVALITDAAERSGSLTLAGSDNLPAQAVLYATAEEPLIGEELYASGAYIQAGPMHIASLRAQDVCRWVIIAAIFVGAVLRILGLL